ncbi:restriction endonuclease subunit S [Staphylococcus hominis]|uniref:restriction endonuclease subunit S n=1 Tax=Staphylococcus hominis TaxID=1290 RepID=UPI000D1E3970|nr:restriction endonuclease subunit S [Staphylococcus hominis]PTK39397.1 restriction endonuclease subunit S [Staphylococcus hominis]
MEYKLEKLIDSVSIKHPFSKKNVVFLNTSDIEEGNILKKEYSKIDDLPGQAKKSIQPNDILYSEIRPKNKRYAYINFECDDYVVSTKLMVLRNINPDLVHSKYLYYFLIDQKTVNYLQNIAESRSGTFPQITFSEVKNLKLDLPSIEKQITIINIMDTLNEKINNNNKIIANLEELSQTLFKRWFVDFEFPDENGNPYKSSGGEMIDSELGEIPSGWKVDELGNYIKIKSGKRPKNKVDKKDIENVVPIIGASKIMGYTNDYLYNEKIIIIGRVGTHGVIQRFSTRTWPSDNTFVIISDFESIIYQVLKSIDYISLNRGSTQPLLSQKDIKNTKVAMPTNETLLSIYQKENNHILKMMDQKNIENQKLTQLRDTLLPKLMSGEIEIPNDIEVNEDELSI